MYSQYFQLITAIDTSASQIDEAAKLTNSSNIQYKVATAEELPVENESVDVICSAEAIHWVNFEKFWNECRRVLKPDGSLALYGYDMPYVYPAYAIDDSERDRLKQRARELTMQLQNNCRFHERIHHINNLYVEIFDDPRLAQQRERSLKKWPHDWKINLIERENLNWDDLYDGLNN